MPAARGIPVIVVTARALKIDRGLGLQVAKVDDYIARPFGPQDLMDSVEKILIQKTPEPSCTSHKSAL